MVFCSTGPLTLPLLTQWAPTLSPLSRGEGKEGLAQDVLNANELRLRARQPRIKQHATVRSRTIRLAAFFTEIAAGGADAEAGLLAPLQVCFKQIGKALGQSPSGFAAQVIQ